MITVSNILLKNTESAIWRRGEVYADKGKVRVKHADDQLIEAYVEGTEAYAVSLKFTTRGIKQECDCPYYERNRITCKHIVATAIVWDESRGMTRPHQNQVEQRTILPPRLSRSDIHALYNNPLKADLEHLRILADETALGGKGRPHSELPNQPKALSKENVPLTRKEMRSCYSEIKRWSRRRAYDPYFCAGEMVAAFCEVMRSIRRRLSVTSLMVAVQILLDTQEFNRTLILELIDDSQGLHELTEAHLNEIFDCLRSRPFDVDDDTKLSPLLRQFRERRGMY